MTISSTTRRAGPYTGNSVTTAFPFAFKVFAATDVLVVEAVVATGVETVKTLTTHYTVALNPDQDMSPGGTVNMLVAPTAAQTITLGSQVPNLQPVEVTHGGGFYPPVLNDALDRATIQIQQLEEQMSRVVGAPISTPSGVDYALPAPLANNVIGWNAGATALENKDPALFGGGGGGGGGTVLGGVNVPNFTLNQATTTAKHQVPSTNPLGWNLLPSRKTVDCEFICNNYFLYNPGGHVALVTRCDTAIVESQVSGQGAIFGDLTWSGFDGDEALFKPTAIIETWDPTKTAGERYLFPNTTGPRGLPMVDGLRYRWIVESTLSNEGSKYVRQRLYRYAGATKQGWDLLVDTGDVLDHNTGADLTKEGLVFGYVLGENLGVWSIDFSNIKVTWGPPGNLVSDNATQLSKFGADLSGDLTFVGNARRIRAPFNAGPSLTNSLTVQSSDANTSTTLVLKPNGSSTSANVMTSNNGSSAATYGAAVFGMAGSVGLVETFGYAAANPDFGINIGASNRVATFSGTGEALSGDLTFVGNARRIQAPFNAGPSLTNSLTVQSSTANTATTLVVKPNGSSTSANLMFSNNSNSSATYRAAIFGMEGSVGLIQTLGYADSDPALGVNIGAGNRVATFSSTGVSIKGASLEIGPPSTTMLNMNNIGGTNAAYFCNFAFDFEVGSTDGNLRTFMSATPSNVEVEQVLRPIYCFLSCLLAELRYRKVI